MFPWDNFRLISGWSRWEKLVNNNHEEFNIDLTNKLIFVPHFSLFYNLFWLPYLHKQESTTCFFVYFCGCRENRPITPPAQGGADGSVRLYSLKTPPIPSVAPSPWNGSRGPDRSIIYLTEDSRSNSSSNVEKSDDNYVITVYWASQPLSKDPVWRIWLCYRRPSVSSAGSAQ